MPCAIFASVLAVAGAIRNKSAHVPKSIWLFQSPLSGSKKSIRMGLFDRVAMVSGVMNSFARGVITTWTSAPCFTSNLVMVAAL